MIFLCDLWAICLLNKGNVYVNDLYMQDGDDDNVDVDVDDDDDDDDDDDEVSFPRKKAICKL